MKDIGMSRIRKGLCLCAMSAVPLAQAEDLPWKFEGDTHRDADVRVASPATELSSFQWRSGCAVQQDVLDSFATSLWASGGTSLTSMKIGFLLFLR